MNIIAIREELSNLYIRYFNTAPNELKQLPLTGSNRIYFRIEGTDKSVIGTYNEDIIENKAFLYLGEKLSESGVNVPKAITVSDNTRCYLQEDLGNTNLYDLVIDEKNEEKIISHYKKVLDQMPSLQIESAKSIDFNECYPRKVFDKQSIQWDLNYFKYMFLKLTYVPFHEQKLEDEFLKLIGFLDESPSNFFLFRDFQSRNIIFNNGQPYFIDFQGGRQGALQYDLASLLFESKVSLSVGMRDTLLDYYCSVFSKYDFFDTKEFKYYYPAFVLVRILQAFGAYGYRGIFEKKAFFVQSILKGLENLKWVAQQPTIANSFPYLCSVIDSMQELKDKFNIIKNNNGLTVTITSFSYKVGLPDDWSGNGGGHVFDCRALPNPGRLEEFRNLTGRDIEVQQYLQQQTEVFDFIETTNSIVEASVSKYIERGFTNLSVSFGCTGGQHRSVYAAQKLFEHLKLNFDVNLRLFHREQNIRESHDKTDV